MIPCMHKKRLSYYSILSLFVCLELDWLSHASNYCPIGNIPRHSAIDVKRKDENEDEKKEDTLHYKPPKLKH